MAGEYIRWDDPKVEPPVPNEDELVHEIIQLINRTQEHNFSMHRHAFRGTHVKTQAVLKGTLTVEPNLPPELAQGICSAENGKQPHAIALRFANEPSFLQDDRTPGPRGCGMKIFDVQGTFMNETGTKTRTQDLTFNNAPLLELKDMPTTVEIFRIRERHFRNPEKIPEELHKRSDSDLQMAPTTTLPNQHFVSYTMYSQSAYRWGEVVVKYALFPTGELQKRLGQQQKITDQSDPEQHSKWLREYFATNDATYDLRVQVCQDLDKQPVEDASVPWDEAKFPFQTVAKVVLPMSQDGFASQRRTFWEERMRLNVWYGLEAHRPLGSVNRLRKELYKASKEFRTKTNAIEIVDVDAIGQIP